MASKSGNRRRLRISRAVIIPFLSPWPMARPSKRGCWSPAMACARNCATLPGIKTVDFDYGQSGIVTTVEHERPHDGTAEEHFLPAGPFATLPLKNNRSSLVWTERTRDADRLIASDDLVFEEELERRFGHKLGALKVCRRPPRLSAGTDTGARSSSRRVSRWRAMLLTAFTRSPARASISASRMRRRWPKPLSMPIALASISVRWPCSSATRAGGASTRSAWA